MLSFVQLQYSLPRGAVQGEDVEGDFAMVGLVVVIGRNLSPTSATVATQKVYGSDPWEHPQGARSLKLEQKVYLLRLI